jgi:hypothetical protein
MSVDNLSEEALERKRAWRSLLERGFHVLAVKKGEKRPDPLLAPSGFLDATVTPDTALGWLEAKPGLNVGVSCGADFGIVVLDVDVKNGARGLETLKDLWIDMPTLTARTPSGGYHLYFRHPGVPLVSKLDGIDIKGADGGGYVLAPPSVLSDEFASKSGTKSGAYAWLDPEVPIADFPKFLLDELRSDGGKPRAKGSGEEKRGSGAPHNEPTGREGAAKPESPGDTLRVPQGRRHDKLVELGAVYRGKGLDTTDIEVLLWEHATRYFDPPFDRESAADRKEIEDVLRWFGAKAAPEEKRDHPLVLLTTPQLMAQAVERVSCLLDPILPAAGNLLIHGPSGSGKSHLSVSIALALAQGRNLLDWTVTGPVKVLYCDGEMPIDELQSRLAQYLRGAPAPETLVWAAARAQEGDMPDLGDPDDQAHYLAAVEACGAQVVIFDNLTCLRWTNAESPENSIEAWLPVAAFVRRLNRRGVAVIIVHHSAKSGSARGSSGIPAPMDTTIRIAPPGEGQADPRAELDLEIHFEKHRRFGGEAALSIRAKVIGDADGFATWERSGADPLVDDVVRLRKDGKSIREIASALQRSKHGVEKAIQRAKGRGLLPLSTGEGEDIQ